MLIAASNLQPNILWSMTCSRICSESMTEIVSHQKVTSSLWQLCKLWTFPSVSFIHLATHWPIQRYDAWGAHTPMFVSDILHVNCAVGQVNSWVSMCTHPPIYQNDESASVSYHAYRMNNIWISCPSLTYIAVYNATPLIGRTPCISL